jgi:lysophospholipase L1-like esterase
MASSLQRLIPAPMSVVTLLTQVYMLFALVVIGASTLSAAEREGFAWHEVEQAHIEGQGWTDTDGPFDRLPARAKSLVREPVWNLSRDSSGLNVQFTTDATSIAARWTLNSEELAMYHMPATGVSGVDLYAKQGDDWHYLGTGRATEYPQNEWTLAADLEGESTEYRLYFPLYNGVNRVEIGVPDGAAFEWKTPAPRQRAVVIYGTSITQGGCASRPGMSYTSLLSRRLGVPVVNLGFSGNGKSEPEIAHLLAELDPAAYVLDPLPNMFPEDVERRLPEFIEILRAARPTTPILLVENPLYPTIGWRPSGAKRVSDSNERLRQVLALRQQKGDENTVLVPACDLTEDNGEGTVDGVHPTDLGFVRLAESIEPYLRKALE